MASDAHVWRRRSAGIFISYRRADTAPYAGRIRDHLVNAFPEAEVFMDIEGIAPGDDFVRVIDQKLERCQVALALIGGRWLVNDEHSGKLGPGPHVAREVSTALRRGIRVIPVLVAGARLPRPEELPPDLMPLLQRNALEIDDKRFATDIGQLLATLREDLPRPRRPALWAVGAAIAVTVTVAWLGFTGAPAPLETIQASALPALQQPPRSPREPEKGADTDIVLESTQAPRPRTGDEPVAGPASMGPGIATPEPAPQRDPAGSSPSGLVAPVPPPNREPTEASQARPTPPSEADCRRAIGQFNATS